MNVASLDLCKELYELSGWGNGYKDLSSLSAYWKAGKLLDNPTVHRFAPDVLLGEFYGRMLFTVPAYDLGYLLRKLPQHCRVFKEGNGKSYVASHSRVYDEGGFFYQEEASPEDAACKLAIELFKQGILTKEES